MRAQQRVYRNPIANRPRLLLLTLPPLRLPPVRSRYSPLQMIEDRRRWSPALRPPMRVVRRAAVPARLTERLYRGRALVGRPAFVDPRRVAVCVRRSQRREVLFATRNTGRGARAPRRRNALSDVRC